MDSSIKNLLVDCGLCIDDSDTCDTIYFWKPISVRHDRKTAIAILSNGDSPVLTINPFFMHSKDVISSDGLTGDEKLVNFMYIDDYCGTDFRQIFMTFFCKYNHILPFNIIEINGRTKYTLNHIASDVIGNWCKIMMMDVLRMHENIMNIHTMHDIDNF